MEDNWKNMRTEGTISERVLVMLQQELVLQVLLMYGRCSFAFVFRTELVFMSVRNLP